MKHFVCVLLLILTATSSMAQGNDHGNGGGVICIKDHCQTLAEAGLALSPQYPFWIPQNRVLDYIRAIVGSYPFIHAKRVQLHSHILLNMTHFKVVEVVDQVKLDQIKQFYIDTIKTEMPTFDLSNFKVAAMSTDDSAEEQVTYILPDFFTLDERTQAQVLIHEGFYRGRPSTDLNQVLKLETALQGTDQTAMISAQIAAHHLGILNKAEVLAHMLMATYNFNDLHDKGYGIDSCIDAGELIRIEKKQDKLSLHFNREYVLKTSHFDGRTAVLLLNIGPLAVKEIQASSWSDRLNPIVCTTSAEGFLYQARPHIGRLTSLDIENPEQMILLLPK